MEKMLEQDMEKYLLLLADKGAKLPKDFDVNQLKETTTPRTTSVENPNQIDALTKQIQQLQLQFQNIQQGPTKRYSLKDICPYPFDPSINMIPFPRYCEYPTYNKYNGRTDPFDHVREF